MFKLEIMKFEKIESSTRNIILVIRWPRRAIPNSPFLDFYFGICDFQSRISKITISNSWLCQLLFSHISYSYYSTVSYKCSNLMLLPAALSVGELKKNCTSDISTWCDVTAMCPAGVGVKGQHAKIVEFSSCQSVSESFNSNTRIFKVYHFQNGRFPNLYKIDTCRGICSPIHQ